MCFFTDAVDPPRSFINRTYQPSGRYFHGDPKELVSSMLHQALCIFHRMQLAHRTPWYETNMKSVTIPNYQRSVVVFGRRTFFRTLTTFCATLGDGNRLAIDIRGNGSRFLSTLCLYLLSQHAVGLLPYSVVPLFSKYSVDRTPIENSLGEHSLLASRLHDIHDAIDDSPPSDWSTASRLRGENNCQTTCHCPPVKSLGYSCPLSKLCLADC